MKLPLDLRTRLVAAGTRGLEEFTHEELTAFSADMFTLYLDVDHIREAEGYELARENGFPHHQ